MLVGNRTMSRILEGTTSKMNAGLITNFTCTFIVCVDGRTVFSAPPGMRPRTGGIRSGFIVVKQHLLISNPSISGPRHRPAVVRRPAPGLLRPSWAIDEIRKGRNGALIAAMSANRNAVKVLDLVVLIFRQRRAFVGKAVVQIAGVWPGQRERTI